MKRNQALLALAALALPLSAFAVDMPAGVAPGTPQAPAHLPAEAPISILPSTLTPAQAGVEQEARVIPFPSATMTLWGTRRDQAAAAAKADVQAMLAPKKAVVPAGMDVTKMSGDQAAGAGDAIMDRILYQVTARKASEIAAPVAGSEGSSGAPLKPARRGIVRSVMSVPSKVAQVTTDYVSKKTGSGPRLTAGLLGLSQMVAGVYMMADAALGQGVPLRWGIAGYLFFGIIMMSAYGGVLSKLQEQVDARKLAARAAELKEQLKDVPGVVGVEGGKAKLNDGNEDVVVVEVSRLDSSNIAKIPKKAGRYSVQVEFVR